MAKPKRDFSAQRRAELARIHILAGELGLAREQYEAVLWTLARVESSRDLDGHGRRQVIEHLVREKQRRDPDRPHNIERLPQLVKIEAQLAAARPWAYAKAMARRMYGKEAIEFCSDQELAGIIAALARDAQRHGRRTR